MPEISKENRSPIYGKVIHRGILLKSNSLIIAGSKNCNGKFIFNTFNQKNIFLRKIPFVRGIINLITDTLILHEVSKWLSNKKTEITEKNNTKSYISIVTNSLLNNLIPISLLIIFIFIPCLTAEKITTFINMPYLFNLFSGILRISFLISYVSIISFSPDVQKLYRLHGSEHKAVNSYNKKETIKNSSIFHLKCSSNSIIFYLLFSILFYTVFDFSFYSLSSDINIFNRIIIHLTLLPFLLSTGFEIWLIILNYFPKTIIIISHIPGLHLQKLVTAEPGTEEIELAEKTLKYFQAQKKIISN